MEESFLPFHTFPDASLIGDFIEKLEKNNIVFEVEKTPKILDSTISGISSDPDIVVKLRSRDFVRAHECLEEYYKNQISNIDKDYYLFSFSDNELFEIISKPDEWGYLDYELAQKILIDRGQKIDTDLLQKLKSERNRELAKEEHPGFFLYFLAYFFIFNGLLAIISPVFFYGDFTFMATLFSVFIGRSIYKNKKTLPNGQSVFCHPIKDRNRGKFLMSFGLIVFICGAIRVLIFILS
jgi:hypothetical protein